MFTRCYFFAGFFFIFYDDNTLLLNKQYQAKLIEEFTKDTGYIKNENSLKSIIIGVIDIFENVEYLAQRFAEGGIGTTHKSKMCHM